MSALGQKQTWHSEIAMSALPPKADIAEHDWNVRFVRITDIARCRARISDFAIITLPSAGKVYWVFALAALSPISPTVAMLYTPPSRLR
jgi:hypothetical protein